MKINKSCNILICHQGNRSSWNDTFVKMDSPLLDKVPVFNE